MLMLSPFYDRCNVKLMKATAVLYDHVENRLDKAADKHNIHMLSIAISGKAVASSFQARALISSRADATISFWLLHSL